MWGFQPQPPYFRHSDSRDARSSVDMPYRPFCSGKSAFLINTPIVSGEAGLVTLLSIRSTLHHQINIISGRYSAFTSWRCPAVQLHPPTNVGVCNSRRGFIIIITSHNSMQEWVTVIAWKQREPSVFTPSLLNLARTNVNFPLYSFEMRRLRHSSKRLVWHHRWRFRTKPKKNDPPRIFFI